MTLHINASTMVTNSVSSRPIRRHLNEPPANLNVALIGGCCSTSISRSSENPAKRGAAVVPEILGHFDGPDESIYFIILPYLC